MMLFFGLIFCLSGFATGVYGLLADNAPTGIGFVAVLLSSAGLVFVAIHGTNRGPRS